MNISTTNLTEFVCAICMAMQSTSIAKYERNLWKSNQKKKTGHVKSYKRQSFREVLVPHHFSPFSPFFQTILFKCWKCIQKTVTFNGILYDAVISYVMTKATKWNLMFSSDYQTGINKKWWLSIKNLVCCCCLWKQVQTYLYGEGTNLILTNLVITAVFGSYCRISKTVANTLK